MYLVVFILLICAYIEEKATTCCTCVPGAVRKYLLHLLGTRVASNVRPHLYSLLFLLMHVRTQCTYCFN